MMMNLYIQTNPDKCAMIFVVILAGFRNVIECQLQCAASPGCRWASFDPAQSFCGRQGYCQQTYHHSSSLKEWTSSGVACSRMQQLELDEMQHTVHNLLLLGGAGVATSVILGIVLHKTWLGTLSIVCGIITLACAITGWLSIMMTLASHFNLFPELNYFEVTLG